MKNQEIILSNIRIVFLFAFCFKYAFTFAQEKIDYGEVKGVVIDQTTLQPIPFVTVQIKELGEAASADENGEFHFKEVLEGKYTLLFSFVGYQEKSVTEVWVAKSKTYYIEVELNESEAWLEAVEVQGFKYEDMSSMPTGTFSLSREEIFRSPASNGNIFKAISVIPGVQSGGGSFSALAVRGQGSEENAMFVDGFPIFELSHLAGGAGAGVSGGFDDPNGGRFSIFGPRVIDGLVIQTGGFNSLYGRKSASYLELDVKEGNPENVEADVMVALTGASASYSGPTFHKKTTLFTSLRYQNFVRALKLTGQADLGDPSFSDLTIKSVTKINKNNKMTFLALFNPEWFKRTTEHIAQDEELENVLIADARNQKGLLGLKWRTLLNENSNWINLAYYRFKSVDLQFGKAYPVLNASKPTANQIAFNDDKGRLDNVEEEIGIRSIYTLNIGDYTTLRVGVDAARVDIDHSRKLNGFDTLYSFYRSQLPINQRNQNYYLIAPQYFNSTFNDYAYNASSYANIQFVPIKKLVLNTGLRYDYTGFSKVGRISPRWSVSYKISDKSSVNASTGIFYQDPLFIQVADNDGAKLEPEKVFHCIGGVKHHFSSDLKLTAEVYYKTFDNLIVPDLNSINQIINKGDGYAYGIDISLVKRLSKKYNGQVSYSYSQSIRDNKDGIGEYDHLYSQPHLVNFLISYQPNYKWIFSGKFRYSTGQPTNSAIRFENVHNMPEQPLYGQELTGRHDIRNDDFIGIDVRMDRRFEIGKHYLNLYVDIQNVLNRENASTRTFYQTTGNYEPQALGILPTVGWRLEF